MAIKAFTELDAWKEGQKLVLGIYAVTKNFPKEELFCLVAQIRRAAISVVSNIAEGFSKKSKSEKEQFYHTSLGSLLEVECQLLIARDLNYLTINKFKELNSQLILVRKLILGLIRSASSI